MFCQHPLLPSQHLSEELDTWAEPTTVLSDASYLPASFAVVIFTAGMCLARAFWYTMTYSTFFGILAYILYVPGFPFPSSFLILSNHFVFGQKRTTDYSDSLWNPACQKNCQSFKISSHHGIGWGTRCCRAWCTVHAPAQSTGETLRLRPRHSTSSISLLSLFSGC